MIRDGIPTDQVETYLHARRWLTDAARLLGTSSEALAVELVRAMLLTGALNVQDGKFCATAMHAPVASTSLKVPFPQDWPAAPGRRLPSPPH